MMLKSDVDTLLPNCYLSDSIIEFYFRYLSTLHKKDDILLVGPTESLCLANKLLEAESLNLSSKRVVVFVINDDFSGDGTGSHWSTLVYERSKNVFMHLDTSRNENQTSALELYEIVKGSMGPGGEVRNEKQRKKQRNKKPSNKNSVSETFQPGDGEPKFMEEIKGIPQQDDPTDCGLYVLAFARAICDEMDDTTDVLSAIAHVDWHSVEDNNNMRVQVSNILKELIKAGDIVLS